MSAPVEMSRKGDVALIRFGRPDAYHAMDAGLLSELAVLTAEVAEDDRVRAVVVTGDEQAFSAGGDLRWILECAEGRAAAVRELAGMLHRSVIAIRRMPKPVIAAVRGVAAGAGMSLALACDLRVLGRGSRLVLAYTSRGLSVDGGASFALPRLVGLARALEILAFDEPIDAERAMAWGLATTVVDDALVLAESLSLAETLSERSNHAFGAAKRLFVDSLGAPLEEQLERECETLARCVEHPDGVEGLAAFAEKRPPVFRRR